MVDTITAHSRYGRLVTRPSVNFIYLINGNKSASVIILCVRIVCEPKRFFLLRNKFDRYLVMHWSDFTIDFS